ncbi:MAG: cytosine permease [Actinobacteria bacterium]|nr:cytosine permease [Actinomycetota bacterium]
MTAVERRGIEHIPQGERWGRPGSLFWMWAGAFWNVQFVVPGAFGIVLLGLSFAQAVVIILVGNLSYILTGLASIQGPQAGTTTFGISRAPFGPNGNRMPSFFNWVTQIGFGVQGIALAVFAGIVLTAKIGLDAGKPVKIIFIVAAVAIQAVLPLLGHPAVLRVLRWLAVPFVVLFAVMAALTKWKVSLHAGGHGASWGTLTIFLALVIAAGGLGWTVNASDYSRYLPRTASKMRVVLAVTLGCALPSALLEILGAAIATGAPGAISRSDLVPGFPGWFVWSFLVFTIVQLFAINTLNLYSSGVTLQSLIPRLQRVHCVAVGTIICGAVAGYAVFSSNFYTLLGDFLAFLVVWLGPWCGIYLADSWLRRGHYDHDGLLNERGGRYYRRSGIHWPAMAAQAIGMVCAALWLNLYPPYVGPLAARVGGHMGSDFSVFLGPIVAALVYYLLARRAVRSEGEATPETAVQ